MERKPNDIVKDVGKELSSYRKDNYDADWKITRHAWYGKQHKTGETKKRVKNYVFKNIETIVPVLTDSMVATQVVTHLLEQQPAGDMLEKSIKYVYESQNLPLLIPPVVRESLIGAPGYVWVHYDSDANNGEGEIQFTQLDWDSPFLDGNVKEIEKSTRFQVKLRKRLSDLIRQWPEHKDELKESKASPKADDSDNDNLETRDVTKEGETSAGAPARANHKDIREYTETWVKDYSTVPVDPKETDADLAKEKEQLLVGEPPKSTKWENHPAHIADHKETRGMILGAFGLPPEASFEDAEAILEEISQDGGAPEELIKALLSLKLTENHIEEHESYMELNPSGEKPKFKDGWRVIKSVGTTILYDDKNPLEDGNIPLVVFYANKDATIYGVNDVINILDPQRSLNTVDQKEYENLKLNANTGWIVDQDAGVNKEDLTNEDGIVIIKNKGTEVRRQAPGEVSPQLSQRTKADRESIRDIMGVEEVTEGKSPHPNASYATIQKMDTRAVGRIRLKDRYLQSYSMRRLAIITASFITHYWTDEKTLRLRGDGTKTEEFIFNPIEMEDLKYRIEMSPGSMTGVDTDALNNFFLTLLDKQHITYEEFLLVSSFPKREILLEKLQERNQSKMELEEISAKLQELTVQNIQLRAAINPELLNPEEQTAFQEIRRQQLLNQTLNPGAAA